MCQGTNYAALSREVESLSIRFLAMICFKRALSTNPCAETLETGSS